MVSKFAPERYEFFVQSVNCFLRQDHPATELLIVHDQHDPDALSPFAAHVKQLRDERIRLVQTAPGLSLGRRRNLAAQWAGGGAICQWDDDDLSHPTRISRQLAAMNEAGAVACYLQETMQYFPEGRRLYWTNWRMTPTGAHPGAMMCRRSAIPTYPDQELAEDTAVLLQLRSSASVATIAAEPHLFVYVSHGRNAWPDAHHYMLVERLAISRSLLLRRESALRAALAPIDFGPAPVEVLGSNGPAFQLTRDVA